MGIFKNLQNELQERDKREGISPAELLSLDPQLRRLMNRINRKEELTAQEAADYMELSLGEVQQLLDSLLKDSYLERELCEGIWVYRIRFSHKRGSQVPLGIWSALDSKTRGKKEGE